MGHPDTNLSRTGLNFNVSKTTVVDRGNKFACTFRSTMIKALALAAALKVCVGNLYENEAEAIKSLNEVENLELFGDFVTIASKNATEFNSTDGDGFDEYLHTHVIRIKAPLLGNKYLNFELSDLIWDDTPEGRKKKMGLRELLIPLLLALKHKLTVVLPIFMALVMGLALKGFWAGMTGLLISKLVALKLLLQSQNKQRDDDHEEEQEENYHEQSDHNSEDNSNPVVIHLNSHRRSGKFPKRRKETLPIIRRHLRPKRWDLWR